MKGTEITLDQALALSTEELELALGDELARQMLGATPPGPKQKKAVAAAWLASMRVTLREKICPNENLKQLFVENVEIRHLATAVFDLISGLVTGVSPVLVSALLVRQGLKLLCEDYWPPADAADAERK